MPAISGMTQRQDHVLPLLQLREDHHGEDSRFRNSANLDIDSTSADASSSSDGASTGVATCYHSSVDSCPFV